MTKYQKMGMKTSGNAPMYGEIGMKKKNPTVGDYIVFLARLKAIEKLGLDVCRDAYTTGVIDARQYDKINRIMFRDIRVLRIDKGDKAEYTGHPVCDPALVDAVAGKILDELTGKGTKWFYRYE